MNERDKRAAQLYDWLDSLAVALVAVVLFFICVFKTYSVVGESMVPTLLDGYRISVVSLLYTPSQGDVVVLDERAQLGDSIVKRVAAVGGQTVNIDRSGEIIVDGQPFADPIEAGSYNLRGDMTFPLLVPEGYIFVLGDNRAHSLDSRFSAVGLVRLESVIGHATHVLLPSSSFGKIS